MKKQVKIHCYGRKKLNGVSSYKIGTGNDLLTKAGWSTVKPPSSRSSYTYMLPPPNSNPSPRNITVELDVPTAAQAGALAERLHALGQPWSGTEFGWRVEYIPAHQSALSVRCVSHDGTSTVEQHTMTNPANFQIGSFTTVWYIGCSWEENGQRWYGYDFNES
jgi:hypothetical protein